MQSLLPRYSRTPHLPNWSTGRLVRLAKGTKLFSKRVIFERNLGSELGLVQARHVLQGAVVFATSQPV